MHNGWKKWLIPSPGLIIFSTDETMVEAYNFLASWQLVPEKSIFPEGRYKKSGQIKFDSPAGTHVLHIENSWVDMENQAYYSALEITVDGEWHTHNLSGETRKSKASFEGSHSMEIEIKHREGNVTHIRFEILPNGRLRVTENHAEPGPGLPPEVTEYQKQLNVLPYASSLGSVAIRPTEQGLIRHKALQAMEEQTNMQLNQIREQIELLARQAQELRKRRDISLIIYESSINFQPVIGQTYFLYEKKDGSHVLSLISEREWGGSMPYKRKIASVKLLADHTWQEIQDN